MLQDFHNGKRNKIRKINIKDIHNWIVVFNRLNQNENWKESFFLIFNFPVNAMRTQGIRIFTSPKVVK